MATLERITPAEAGLTHYDAYKTWFQPLDFFWVKTGRNVTVYAFPAGTTDDQAQEMDGYIWASSPECTNGLLYGAVKAVCGQLQQLEPAPTGKLVVVTYENRLEDDELGATFLYTGSARNATQVEAELNALLRKAHEEDPALHDEVYNWRDVIDTLRQFFAENGYTQLNNSNLPAKVQITGVINVAFDCDERALKDEPQD